MAVWGSVGTGRATLTVNGIDVTVEPNGAFAGYIASPSTSPPRLEFVAKKRGEVVRKIIALTREISTVTGSAHDDDVRALDTWVRMRRVPSDTADSATQWRPIYSRWRPGGNVAVALVQGMRLHADAQTDSAFRLDLADDARVWVQRDDAMPAPARQLVVRVGTLRVAPDAEGGSEISVPASEPLAATVELTGDRLMWTIYNAAWTTPPQAIQVSASSVKRVIPNAARGRRLTIDVSLAALPIGWKSEWRDGAMRLRVRRAHVVRDSVRGLQVLLDPGHPPDGSVGAAGLAEDSVTLAVALEAERALLALGADVRLTRRTPGRLSLEARAAMIEQESPEIFVSIHANSPGPGRPPYAVDRTVAYWMDQHAIALARALAGRVSKSLGQEQRAATQGEYAVLRSNWSTSVLVEGFGLVLPEREAYMRSGEGISAYARGIVHGIMLWNRSPQSRELPSATR